MAITISGENNNDRILAQDGVIDEISGINIVGLLTAGHINVGSNIQLGNAGIITATTFVGNLTGNVNSTSPLLLQTGGSERFRITGNNELGIAGANYGSAGQVLTSGGSGSAVTWSAIPAQATIANNADNRVITGGSGVNLNGESALTFSGQTLSVYGAAGDPGRIQIKEGGAVSQIMTTRNSDSNGDLRFSTEVSGSLAVRAKINYSGDFEIPDKIVHEGDTNTAIRFPAADTISFETTNVERLRIDSSGRVMIGNTNASTMFGGADDLVVGNTSGAHGITIITSNSTVGRLLFSDSTSSGAATYQGQINYNHSTDELDLRTYTGGAITFATSATERLRITADGKIGIGVENPSHFLHLKSASSPSIKLEDTTNTNILIVYAQDSDSHVGTYSNHPLVFDTNSTERLRINQNGKVIIGNNGTTFGNAAVQAFIQHGNTAGESGFSSVDTSSVAAGVGGEIAFHGKYNTGAQDYAYYGHIRGVKENATNGDTACALTFHTRPNATAPIERLRIDSSGNVTINTGNLIIPDSIIHSGDTDTKIVFTNNQIDLQCAGASRAYINNYGFYISSGFALAFLSSSGATPHIKSGGTNAQDLLFTTGSGNPTRLQITSGGTVQFKGDVNPQAEFDRGSANNTNINLKYNGTFTGQVSAANGDFQLSAVGGSTPITFYADGGEKVRIGWNGDNAFLRIADNNTSSPGSHGLRFGSYAIQMRDTGGYNHWYIRRNYGGWQTQPQVTLKANGYTGVNRLDPSHYLDVDGSSIFRDRIYFGTGSMKSIPFGANVTYDTGISINGYGYGGSILALCSRNYGAGTSTQAGLYYLEFKYDGNHVPTIHHVAGDSFVTFNKSASNTLTVNMGASNNNITMIESSVINP